jgi:hypothetical protein
MGRTAQATVPIGHMGRVAQLPHRAQFPVSRADFGMDGAGFPSLVAANPRGDQPANDDPIWRGRVSGDLGRAVHRLARRRRGSRGQLPRRPRQVDFSRFAGGALPANFLSDDGSVSINFSIVDPWGLSQAAYTGIVWNSVLNGLDNPVITAMQNARSGRYVDLIFQFSTPVCPSFSLVDVDRSTFSWEDTVRVIGSDGGGTINPSAMSVGGAQVQINANTVRGTSSTSSATGNVGVEFDQPITRLEIRHQDNSNWTSFQWIGIHDFHWC